MNKNQKKTFLRLNSKFCIPNSTLKGFSLIEVLVVISIFTMLLGIGLFFSFDFYRGYQISTERDIAVGILEKARSRAMSNIFESSHGVHVEQGQYVIFRGNIYVVGAGTNEVIPGNATISKNPMPYDIVFAELTGLPDIAGNLTLSDGVNIKIITINNEGRIDW
ncbi:MAG: prepilin-type N-terminal cleavage/methylation domain-containing protein [bacterium]|nr:prepilin-type N-terminal cleavage/methylation domain-containing protein [bacterium]